MKRLIISILILLFLTVFIIACPTGPTDSGDGGDNGDDSQAPTITDFTLTSPDPTSDTEISFTLEATDNVGVTGWLINQSSDAPAVDDIGWLDTKPTSYIIRITQPETVTVYAWAKDDAGNISDSASFSVEFDGEEDPNWNMMIDGNGGYDVTYDIAMDSNMDVYVVGAASDISGTDSGYDWWIKKYDIYGVEDTENWDKIVDTDKETDRAKAVAIDSNDNVYVGGYGENLVSTTSSNDWRIKKYSPDGTEDTTNWDKAIDGGNDDSDYIQDMIIDSNDNLIVAGYGKNLVGSGTQSDWWIKKFDPNGVEDTNWDIQLDGNSDNDIPYDMAFDSSGNLYVVGHGRLLISANSSTDVWIKKFDPNGNEDTINWDKSYNTFEEANVGYGIAIDSSDNIYIVASGYESISDPNTSWWLKKFDSNGNEDTTNWDFFVTNNGEYNTPGDIIIDSNDNIYVGGMGTDLVDNTSKDWWIKKYDVNGVEDTAWEKMYNGNDQWDDISSMAFDHLENLLVVGEGSKLIDPDSSNDWWIKKIFK